MPEVIEGTGEELIELLNRHPDDRYRLVKITENGGSMEKSEPIDAENLAAIALLNSYLEMEATDDPEEIRRAEEELGEFKRNMNANRASTGERPVFP